MALGFWLFHQDVWGLSEWLAATPEQVFGRHELWRAWSTIFVHADLEHLLGNIGYFAGLAFLLRGYFGWLAFPFLSLLFGGIINLLSLATYAPDVELVGASGVVYFMAAFWLALYLFSERGTRLSRRVANCVGFVFVLLLPQSYVPSVSYRTHFIGLAVGALVGGVFFALNRNWIRRAEVGGVAARPGFNA